MASVAMTVQDLKDRFEGDLTTRFSPTYISIKLADAVALVASEAPTAAVRRESGLLSDNNYFRVVANVALRVLRNPGGMESESEAGAGYKVNADVASGDMFITPREMKTLTGIAVEDQKKSVPSSVSIGVDVGWGS